MVKGASSSFALRSSFVGTCHSRQLSTSAVARGCTRDGSRPSALPQLQVSWDQFLCAPL